MSEEAKPRMVFKAEQDTEDTDTWRINMHLGERGYVEVCEGQAYGLTSKETARMFEVIAKALNEHYAVNPL